jgi:hypothetical protein
MPSDAAQEIHNNIGRRLVRVGLQRGKDLT